LVTIDEAIKKLQHARFLMGGDKPLSLRIAGSEMDGVNVDSLEVVTEPNGGESQCVQVNVNKTPCQYF
jgi:hypothetical protein